MAPRGHVPDGVVALLDLAQRVLGAAQVGGRVELLGLGEQLLLQLSGWPAPRRCASCPTRCGPRRRRPGRRGTPSTGRRRRRGRCAARPSSGPSATRIAALVGPQSVEVDSCCGLLDQLLLGRPGLPALGVERGEVRTPAAAEGVPGGGEPGPERLVGLPVDAADRLPLLDDGLQPVAGGLPLTWTRRRSARPRRPAPPCGRSAPARGRPSRRGSRPRPSRPCSTIARARAARPSRSPTAAAVGIDSASACALFLISPGLPVCAFSRASSRAPRWRGRRSGGRSGPAPRPARRPARSRRRARPRRCGRRRCRPRRRGPRRWGRTRGGTAGTRRPHRRGGGGGRGGVRADRRRGRGVGAAVAGHRRWPCRSARWGRSSAAGARPRCRGSGSPARGSRGVRGGVGSGPARRLRCGRLGGRCSGRRACRLGAGASAAASGAAGCRRGPRSGGRRLGGSARLGVPAPGVPPRGRLRRAACSPAVGRRGRWSPRFSAIGGVACCAPAPGLSVLDTSGSVPRRIRDTAAVTAVPETVAGRSRPRSPSPSAPRRRCCCPPSRGAPSPATAALRRRLRRRGATGCWPTGPRWSSWSGTAPDRRAVRARATRRPARIRRRPRAPVRRPGAAGRPRACRSPHLLGAWLLDQAGHRGTRVGVGPDDLGDGAGATCRGPVGVLAMGDGSARRTVKAPGLPRRRRRPLRRRRRRRPGRRRPGALAALDAGRG